MQSRLQWIQKNKTEESQREQEGLDAKHAANVQKLKIALTERLLEIEPPSVCEIYLRSAETEFPMYVFLASGNGNLCREFIIVILRCFSSKEINVKNSSVPVAVVAKWLYFHFLRTTSPDLAALDDKTIDGSMKRGTVQDEDIIDRGSGWLDLPDKEMTDLVWWIYHGEFPAPDEDLG